MGIESEEIVYDYLSRVGDLAQRALPADRRRELVARLRDEIEERRAEEEDTPAGVRRILGSLGSPDDVVEAEALHRAAEGVPPPFPGDTTQMGPSLDPQWWRTAPPRERNPLLDPPDEDDLPGLDGFGIPGPRAPLDGEEDDAGGGEGVGKRRRRWWSRPVPVVEEGGAQEEKAPRGGLLSLRGVVVHWREVAAAAVLVAGTVLGLWVVVVIGWAFVYYTSRLSRAEAGTAAIGIPFLSALGAGVYVWGRARGRWGEPLPDGHVRPVLEDVLPLTVRVAAVASAVYLLWRADRRSRLR